MTKSMLEKCLNKEMRAFCALDEDVREAIFNHMNIVLGNQCEKLISDCGTYLTPKFRWVKASGFNYNQVIRLSPDTPTEPEYEELNVFKDSSGYLAVRLEGEVPLVTTCQSHNRFIGIIYTLNGVETLRTSVDAAFGTPVRVRFAKGE